MPRTTANGIEIEYEDHGDPADPAMLLIMGFASQLTVWPPELIRALVGHGFRVIVFDNRDIGLSHKFEGVKAPGVIKLLLLTRLGITPRVPYTLGDMADDAAGLLDALGIPAAHIVGASMGGMIAQHFAVRYPQRTLSLTSVMSTTGNPRLPQAKPDAFRALIRRPTGGDEATLVAHGMNVARTIGSPAYPADEDRLRERVTANLRRNFYPQGVGRQLAAIAADGDRRSILKGVSAPTLVMHGIDDPLVPVEGGRDTAAAIPDARIVEIPGMGHNLPLELIDTVASAIVDHARQAAAAGS